MADRLPVLYAVVLVVELVALTVRYLSDPPGASDPLSIWLGWGGLVAMIVMLIYSVARRSRAMRQWARLSTWLHFHIFMGTQGLLLTLFHSSHLFSRDAPISWLNPGLLCFIAVIVVFSSGIFGRYMYSWLPRTMKGERMSEQEAERELAAASAPLPQQVQAELAAAGPPPSSGFVGLVKADLEARRARRRCLALVSDPALRDLVDRRLVLQRRLLTLRAAERVFRLWLVAHRPIAAIMYVLAAVHITLSYMFTPGL